MKQFLVDRCRAPLKMCKIDEMAGYKPSRYSKIKKTFKLLNNSAKRIKLFWIDSNGTPVW